MRSRINAALVDPVALMWQNMRVVRKWCQVTSAAYGKVMDLLYQATSFVDVYSMGGKINNDPAPVWRNVDA